MNQHRSRAHVVGEQKRSSLLWKMLVVPLIVSLVLSAFATTGVLAAPSKQGGGGNNDLEQSWADKRGQLAIAVSFFNNFRTKPGLDRNSGNMSQYLDRYAAALSAAQSLVVNGGFDANGNVTNENQARKSIQQMQNYLTAMRGLRQKLAQGAGDNGNNNGNNNGGGNNGGNNNGGNGGVGIPVTGGNSNNNNGNQNANQNSPAHIWGNQWRQLQAATAWYNNFRTQPGKMRNAGDQAKIQQYLDQYAFALGQANAIILNGNTNANGQSNNSGSNGQGTTVSGWGSGSQRLNMYLTMMRGLREKIAQGGNSNNNNGGNDTGTGTGSGTGTP